MARFAVTYSSLSDASALLLGDELATPPGDGGAAAGTPAAGAWSQFVDTAGRSLSDSHEAVSAISRSLGLAARIYELSDHVSAANLTMLP